MEGRAIRPGLSDDLPRSHEFAHGGDGVLLAPGNGGQDAVQARRTGAVADPCKDGCAALLLHLDGVRLRFHLARRRLQPVDDPRRVGRVDQGDGDGPRP